MKDAEAALEIDSLQTSSWIVRAIIRIAHRNYKGAIADCDQAIELDPRYAEGYSHRAMAREGSGDLEGAKADYAKSIELQFNSSLSAEIRRE
jgi:Flp pilus assembly protein TadD